MSINCIILLIIDVSSGEITCVFCEKEIFILENNNESNNKLVKVFMQTSRGRSFKRLV
jgi:hypothetical protein